MHLDFNPGIGTYTVIHVPEVGDAHLRFTAYFPSREVLEQARNEGIRLEMWTNLPVNGSHHEWHALPFAYPDESKTEQSTAFALSPNVDAPAGRSREIYLDMVLPSSCCGSRYSFTYRLVRPWGALEWLGAWGHNGDLVIERLEERFALGEGCSLKEGVVVRDIGSSSSEPTIELKQPLNWVTWAIDDEGWTTYSPKAYASASKAILLVPRLPEDFTSRRILQPLFLSAGTGPSATVSVSTDGKVSGHNASNIIVLDASSDDFIPKAKSILPKVEIVSKTSSYVILKSSVAEVSAPLSVSVMPVASMGTREGVKLTYHDLLTVHPHISKENTLLVDLAQPAFTTVPTEPTDFSVKVGPYGGNCVLSSLHILEEASEELPWNLAVLSPSSFARIATETSGEELARLLPTPPPSPPPMSTSFAPSSSFVASVSRSSGMSIALPSIAEVVAKDMEQPVPLTPLSPPPRPDHALEDEPERSTEYAPTETERHVTLSTSRSQSIRGSLLRFFLAWLLRSVIARVFGFFAPVARYWGLPGFWDYDEETKKELEVPQQKDEEEEEVRPEPLDGVSDTMEDLHGDDNVYLSTHESVGPALSPSETTLADSDDEMPEKEHYVPTKLETAPSMETVVHVLDDRPAPIFISPRAPPKPRFLADISSNTVSLLVRAPHARRALADLKIHLGGKPIAEGDAGYTCTRMSDDVFLLGLTGPQEGGRLEVAVD